MSGGLVVDLFAGGGGASTGIEAALGRPIDLAVNHSATAIAVHEANHPRTRHLTCDVYEVNPVEATGGAPVDVLWASPDCRDFSKAKGGKPKRPRSKKIRALAWVVVRWAQAVRPRVIFVENVEEFETWGPLDRNQERIPARVGETFRAWVSKLRRLGYVVEWRVLDASRYGAPTRRKRLFIVARCDGEPIVWPEPTHGPGLLPYRTAGECIDWAIPTRSIFGRKKPLAEKTLRRIAEGIRRFVLESPRPYIVRVNHGRDTWRGQSIDEPLTTVEATQRGHAVVSPMVVEPGQRHGRGRRPADEPLGTIVGKDRHALASPVLVRTDMHQSNAGCAYDPKDPLRTITSGGGFAVAAAGLVTTSNSERQGQRPRVKSLDDPHRTVIAKGSHDAIAAVSLVDMQRNNPPRDLAKPLGVITTQVNRFNAVELPLVAAQDRAVWIAKHFGGVVGQAADERLGTVTGRDHHSVVAANLVTFRGDPKDHPGGASLDEPMPTITAQGLHLAECRAFLTKFYSSAGTKGASLFDPAPTATAKARFGLVVVDGVEYEIGDIFLRMLEPEELLRAQFGEFADGYDLSAARTKEAKTRLVGNSVCPHVSRALVEANAVPALEEAAA